MKKVLIVGDLCKETFNAFIEELQSRDEIPMDRKEAKGAFLSIGLGYAPAKVETKRREIGAKIIILSEPKQHMVPYYREAIANSADSKEIIMIALKTIGVVQQKAPGVRYITHPKEAFVSKERICS